MFFSCDICKKKYILIINIKISFKRDCKYKNKKKIKYKYIYKIIILIKNRYIIVVIYRKYR